MEPEINDLIDAIQQQNFNSAKDSFESLLGAKMNTALEQEKIAVADTIFNGAEEEQLDLDLDISDELDEEEEDIVVDEIEDEDEGLEDE